MKTRAVPITAKRVLKTAKVNPDCPTCGKKGKQIDIRSDAFVGFRKRWEEPDGTRHSHDPNPLRIGYRCPKDHEWWQDEVRKCPQGDYP